MTTTVSLLDRKIPPHDRKYFYGENTSQFCELRLPRFGSGPFPVVVGFHGGWWRAEHGLETHSHLCEALTQQGIATWNIEYRRIGEPGGGWPNTLLDASKAVEKLADAATEHNLDLSNVIFVGFSAGGHLAAWTAATHAAGIKTMIATGNYSIKPKLVVSLAGALDLIQCANLKLSDTVVEKFIGGAPATFPDRYIEASPIERLPTRVPFILIHGEQDASVPIEISRRFYNRCRAEGTPCEMIALPGVDHMELIDPLSETWTLVRDKILNVSQAAIGASSAVGELNACISS